MKARYVLVLLGLAACNKGAPAKTAQAPAATGVAIRVAKAERRALEQTVELSGSLASPEDATIAAEVEGRIADLRVDLGDRVKEGDVLVRIGSREFKLRMEQAEAVRVQAEANLRRTEKLAQSEMVAARELDDARSNAAVARASADLARKKYGDTLVRAPFSGAVAKRSISSGEYVKVGQPLFQIVVLDPLKLTGEVPERFLALVQPGDKLAVYVDAFPGKTFEGTVGRVSPAVNPQTRSFAIEARIGNEKQMLKPGVFARAELTVGQTAERVVVPEAALSTFAGVTKVFVIDGTVAHERKVELDRHLAGGLVALLGDTVKPGDLVAVAGTGRLAEGVEVAVK